MAKRTKATKTRRMSAKKAATKPARKIDKAPEIAARRNVKVDAESKALFLDHHLPVLTKLKEAVNRATANLRNGYKAAKKDGFLKRDFDIAFRLRTETGEREIIVEIARDCTIADWLGHRRLGKQLDLFVDGTIDDKDAERMAYADGEEASRKGQPAKPIYAPGTPGYDAFMRGFNDHQDELAKGFKKTEEPSSSGVSMTRSQFRAQQARQAADAAEQRSSQLFTKREPQPEDAV